MAELVLDRQTRGQGPAGGGGIEPQLPEGFSSPAYSTTPIWSALDGDVQLGFGVFPPKVHFPPAQSLPC